MIPYQNGSRNVTAIRPQTWNKIAEAVNGQQLGQGSSPTHPLAGVGTQWVWLKNNGTDRQQYECSGLEVNVAPVLAVAQDGNRAPVMSASDSDDPNLPTVIWQQPAKANTIAKAVISGLSLAMVEPSNATTRLVSRSSNKLAIDDAGSILLLMRPHASLDSLVLVDLSPGGSGSGAIIVWTPTGGIPAAMLGSNNLTLGSAACFLSTRSGSVVSKSDDTVTVYNTVTQPIGGNSPVQCKMLKDGIWVVDVEICGAASGSGPNPNPALSPMSTVWDEDDDLSLGV